MDEGDYVEQVILVELLQAVGELLHVDCLVPARLLLRCVGLAAHAVCIGAGLLEQRDEVRLWVPEGLRTLSACTHVQIHPIQISHPPNHSSTLSKVWAVRTT